jgi:hypothetical protein
MAARVAQPVVLGVAAGARVAQPVVLGVAGIEV